MFNLLKMIIYRTINNKIFLLLVLFVPAILVVGSIVYTNNIEHNVRVGVIGDKVPEIENLSCTILKDKPKLSELVEGRYEAIIEYKDGRYEIESVKGEEFDNKLNSVLNENTSIKEAFANKSSRGVISNLVGFLSMLLLMLGSVLYKFYYQDKGGIARRIVTTKVGYVKYILSYPISVFLVLFIPAWLITAASSYTFNLADIKYPELTFMMFVLCFLGASYSFLVASVSKHEQNGELFTTMSVMITALLSGSFIEIAKGGTAEKISYLFPQRYIVDFAINLENGNSLGFTSMFVIIGVSIAFIILGGIINRRRMMN